MTEIQAIPSVDLVHIRPGFPGESERIDRLLEATGLRVAVFSDVYRALAKLARLAQDGEARLALRAILVQVDDLGPPEMAFFSIASRLLAGTPLLVYGSDRLQSRVELALEGGATDRVSPEIITRLAARAHESAGHDTQSTAYNTEDQDATTPAPVALPDEDDVDLEEVDLEEVAAAEPTAQPDVVRDDPPPQSQPQTGPDESDGEDTTATRVPWLQYQNRPARQAPRRIAPQPTTAAEPDQNHQPDDAGVRKRPSVPEPLLTEEELRALMGDDISSIAPHEAAPNEIDGPATERGDA